MGFKCGIVGLPNVGKSTIFNALTALQVEASNYPFCTIEPNVGIVPLPDERLTKIREIVGSAKMTPTTLEFVDIAGLVKGASQGEGLGNQFLSHIQAVDAIAHVVRCFEDENVAHPYPTLDPIRDAEIVTTELILKDLEMADRRLEKLKRVVKTGDKKIKAEHDLLVEVRDKLSQEIQVKQMGLTEEQRELLRELNFLTAKPTLFIANVDEGHLVDNPWHKQLAEYAAKQGEECILFCGKAQAEIAQLDPESQTEFLKELGLDELGLTRLIRAGYKILNLITFFTANQNEARAWTIPRGTTVHKAAGKVHTDFERRFIKAEVIKYNDLITYGSEAKVKEHGLMAVHGKDYMVEDGDLILFR